MTLSFTGLLHAALTLLSILAGIQDWRTREISDWITWPLFGLGMTASSVKAIHWLDAFPLIVSVFMMVIWYFGWMGGADVRVYIGLWGLWPRAAWMALLATGMWGLVLVLRKRGKEKMPALVSVAFTAALLFVVEQFFYR